MTAKQFRKLYHAADLANRILLLHSYAEQTVGNLPSLPLKKIRAIDGGAKS